MNSFVSKPLEHAGNWIVIQIRYPNGAFKDFSFTADSIDKRNLGYVWAHDFNIGMSYNSGIAIGLGDWGYVFWDEGRLKASGITSDNFEDANQKWKIKVRPPSQEPSGGELLGDFWNVDKRSDQGRSKDSVGFTPKEWKESRRGELGAVAVNGYKLYQPIRWDYSDFDEDSEPGDDQSDDADSN